jgi:hypothetical protein
MSEHIYHKNIQLGVFYTYNDKNEKVFDIKTMRENFKQIVKSLKNK